MCDGTMDVPSTASYALGSRPRNSDATYFSWNLCALDGRRQGWCRQLPVVWQEERAGEPVPLLAHAHVDGGIAACLQPRHVRVDLHRRMVAWRGEQPDQPGKGTLVQRHAARQGQQRRRTNEQPDQRAGALRRGGLVAVPRSRTVADSSTGARSAATVQAMWRQQASDRHMDGNMGNRNLRGVSNAASSNVAPLLLVCLREEHRHPRQHRR